MPPHSSCSLFGRSLSGDCCAHANYCAVPQMDGGATASVARKGKVAAGTKGTARNGLKGASLPTRTVAPETNKPTKARRGETADWPTFDFPPQAKTCGEDETRVVITYYCGSRRAHHLPYLVCITVRYFQRCTSNPRRGMSYCTWRGSTPQRVWRYITCLGGGAFGVPQPSCGACL